MWTYAPTYAYISNGKKHDVTIARKVSLSPGSIITMDRAYNDYRLFALWTESGVYFVTRLKSNADYRVVQEFDVPKNRKILSDQLIRFSGPVSHEQCPHIMRKVVVWDDVNKQQIVLLTNHLKFGATTISAIYKDRLFVKGKANVIVKGNKITV